MEESSHTGSIDWTSREENSGDRKTESGVTGQIQRKQDVKTPRHRSSIFSNATVIKTEGSLDLKITDIRCSQLNYCFESQRVLKPWSFEELELLRLEGFLVS
ncbi:hypothetical protein STEG23_020212, partial [Scotinomys teguina]